MSNQELTEQELLTLEILQQKHINSLTLKLNQATKQIETLSVNLEKQVSITEEINNKVDKLNIDLSQQYEKISHRQHDLIFNYIGLSALGALHAPSIGSQYMGKLLRLLDICKKSNRTEALSEYTRGNDPIAKTHIINGYSTWVFHSSKTWELVKKKLSDRGILNDFEQWTTRDNLHKFIATLEQEQCK